MVGNQLCLSLAMCSNSILAVGHYIVQYATYMQVNLVLTGIPRCESIGLFQRPPRISNSATHNVTLYLLIQSYISAPQAHSSESSSDHNSRANPATTQQTSEICPTPMRKFRRKTASQQNHSQYDTADDNELPRRWLSLSELRPIASSVLDM